MVTPIFRVLFTLKLVNNPKVNKQDIFYFCEQKTLLNKDSAIAGNSKLLMKKVGHTEVARFDWI